MRSSKLLGEESQEIINRSMLNMAAMATLVKSI
jgi:hypothetical protein